MGVRTSVPGQVAMTACGHKTQAIFDRYNIVSEHDIEGVAVRLEAYLDKKTAQGATWASCRTETGRRVTQSLIVCTNAVDWCGLGRS